MNQRRNVNESVMVNKGLGWRSRKEPGHIRRQTPGLSAPVDQHRRHLSREQHFGIAQYALMHFESRPRLFDRPGLDAQHIIKAGWLQKVTDHAPDHKHQPVTRHHGFLVKPQHAQEIRAPALAEFQIVGVIDKAGKIRVLIVNAKLQTVCAGACPEAATLSASIARGPTLASAKPVPTTPKTKTN